jgi:enediyne biosynthesis protein E4
MKAAFIIQVLLVLTAANGSAQRRSMPLFTLMSEKQTGVSFTNEIREDDSLNVLRYEYLYNGAGVGIGDFNRDGLADIFFSSNTSSNKLFLNKGKFHFTDVTKKSGTAGNGTWSTGVCVADINGDGWQDIYVCHSGNFKDPKKLRNELFINQGIADGVPVFKEMSENFGLDAPGTQSTQAAFFDYDRDGDLDMFLLNHSNHTYNPFLNTRKVRSTPNFSFGNRLFRNDRNTSGEIFFKDVTLEAGIINHALNYGLSVTVSDVNDDGWPDIYTTSDYSEKDCFYLNNKNGSFTESLQQSFAQVSKYSMGADIADYNNDGRADVLTLDMLPEDNHRQKLLKGPDEYDQYHLLLDSGYYHQQMRNMLQLNQGPDANGFLRFSEIGQLAGVSNTDWSWAGLFVDFDNDGWKDLLVTNGYLRDYTDLDFLKYTVANAKIEAARQGHQNFQTYELVSRMPSNRLSNYLYKNNHDLSFSNKTRDWGLNELAVSNAAAYADLDNDGDMDMVICNNNDPVFIYRNNQERQANNHYIKIRLAGEGMNTQAIGAKILLVGSDGNRQMQELFPIRGYQSSVSPDIVFGFGKDVSITQLEITWPSGKKTVMKDIPADQLLELEESAAVASGELPFVVKRLFTDISAQSGITFRHIENDFIDFKQEVLLPYQLSRQGPAMAKADVNADGLEDIFFGGAIGQAGQLFLQTKAGNFSISTTHPWEADAESEDVNAVFFDADGDGDKDLYVVSGGNEYGDASPEYQDRLYLNDSKGNFTRSIDALPAMLSNKQAVAAGDFDNDGDDDIFVGGRGLPGSFPLPSRSWLLRNDTKGGKVSFTDVTDDICPALRTVGMVTVACWTDLNKDHYPELMIGGDWMPLMLFDNNKGQLKDVSIKAGLKDTGGWWSAITASDVDADGDMDFILGNCGRNTSFKASKEEPAKMYVADIDNNGVPDPVVCYYIQGKEYPMASRDELLDQVPSLRKKFVKYADYADATITDIFPKELLKKAAVYHCEEFASGILLNEGSNRFSFKAFTLPAQVSKVNSIIADDFDKDGVPDILLAGNFYPYRVQSGRCAASLGLLMKGKGKGIFEPVDPSVSGCYLDGDVRTILALKNATGEKIIIAGKNNEAVQVLKCNE